MNPIKDNWSITIRSDRQSASAGKGKSDRHSIEALVSCLNLENRLVRGSDSIALEVAIGHEELALNWTLWMVLHDQETITELSGRCGQRIHKVINGLSEADSVILADISDEHVEVSRGADEVARFTNEPCMNPDLVELLEWIRGALWVGCDSFCATTLVNSESIRRWIVLDLDRVLINEITWVPIEVLILENVVNRVVTGWHLLECEDSALDAVKPRLVRPLLLDVGQGFLSRQGNEIGNASFDNHSEYLSLDHSRVVW